MLGHYPRVIRKKWDRTEEVPKNVERRSRKPERRKSFQEVSKRELVTDS